MDAYLSGGGVKRVKAEGGNSSLAIRLAKGNRYGKETHKQKFPTHVRFCMRLLTYTTKQTITATGGGVPSVPTTNTPATVGYNLRPDGDVRNYYLLGNRTATGNGVMTLNALGLWWTWAEELPTQDCPWLHTYFAYKLDAAGFNCCDPLQFAQACTRYTHVKQGPYCATFVFPDAPLDDAGPVRRQYPLINSSFLPGATPQGTPITGSAVNPAVIEERGIGAWEMIIIPPRKMKSIWIEQCVSQSGWDSLIDMGFKPRKAQRVTKIYCSNSGLDADDLNNVAAVAGISLTRSRNTGPNFGAGQNFNISDLNYKKMKYIDTEDVCQYTAVADPGADTIGVQTYPDVATSSLPGLQLYAQQGYPCVPYGSAIIFRFRQYAPLQSTYSADLNTVTYQQTCIRQTIPLDLYIDSITTFKNPVKGAFDLDLAFTNPALRPT